MRYSFRKGYGSGTTLEGTVTTEGVFDINTAVSGTLIYADQTPVRAQWTKANGQTAVFYGIYNSEDDTITYDPYIYEAETLTSGLLSPFNTTEYLGTDTYTMDTEIINSNYSTAFIPYNSERNHTIIIPIRRGTFRGELYELVNQNTYGDTSVSTTCFVDLCKGYAYAVAFTEGTFSVLNNKFKSSVEFKVTKK